MTIDTTALRALALAATPGPWHLKSEWTDKHSGADVVYGATGQVVCQCDEHDGGYGGGQRNVEHIAACDPATVLALLDDLARLRALLDTPFTGGAFIVPYLTARGRVVYEACSEEVSLPREYAVQLGAALIRAGTGGVK